MGALTLLGAGMVLMFAVPMAGAQTVPSPSTTAQGYGPTTAPGGGVGGETETTGLGPGGGVSGVTNVNNGTAHRSSGGFLAFTGANVWPLTLFGGLAVLVGGLLALGSRERARSRN